MASFAIRANKQALLPESLNKHKVQNQNPGCTCEALNSSIKQSTGYISLECYVTYFIEFKNKGNAKLRGDSRSVLKMLTLSIGGHVNGSPEL